MSIVRDLFTDHTLRTVALGAATLGIVAGALGSFAVLRRQSLLGDATSHAALPGIALAFLVSGSKAPLTLVLGAAVAGWIGTLLVMAVVRTTRVKYDSALGIVLSVFFGVGLVLLTIIQKRADAAQAGLDRFLFGQAASLLERDLITMAALGGIALAATVLLWKEFKLLTFDPDFGASLGFAVRRLDVLLTALLVIAIVVGLQTVGVVLMSAMVVAPGAAARQWTDRLGVMVVLAAAFGALAGVSGALVSSEASRMPTGPTIVLAAGVVVIVSLFLAPRRGLVWRWLADYRNRRRLGAGVALVDLYRLAEQHDTLRHAHEEAAIAATAGARVRHGLEELAERGWAERVDGDAWALTPAGRAEAERRLGGTG
ncbi:MAG: metal ABC transporter permease [Thermoleophilia bacterium]|nr:metal ABC transporter permease [Thermoleophilia bacterium]